MSTQSLSTVIDELRWVVCPVCHKSLHREGDIVWCQGCGHRYPVIDGIPVLLAGRTL